MNSNHPIYLGVMSGTSLDGVDVVAFTPHNNALIAAHSIDFSTYPFYLGHADELGASAGLGFNLNMPLPAGTAAPTWFGVLQVIIERVRDYRPDVLIVALGVDTAQVDPINSLRCATTILRASAKPWRSWACRSCSRWRVVTLWLRLA